MKRASDIAAAAISNPSTIAHTVGQSIPLMGAGGVVGRGLQFLAPKMAGWAAAGIGEGVVAMGSGAEQMRQQTKDGLLTGEQSLIAAGSGALTGALGLVAGRAAKQLGIGDIDTLIVGGKNVPAELQKGFVRKMLEGVVSEGILEELPQSVQEQVSQNYALGKPLEEGVDQAAVMGMLSGGVMGAGAQMFSRKPAVPEVGPLSRGANMAGGAPVVGGELPPAPPAPAATPLTPEQNQTLLDHGNERLRVLNAKTKGKKGHKAVMPDGSVMTIPDTEPELFTQKEKQEYDFLKAAGGDAEALARAYPGLLQLATLPPTDVGGAVGDGAGGPPAADPIAETQRLIDEGLAQADKDKAAQRTKEPAEVDDERLPFEMVRPVLDGLSRLQRNNAALGKRGFVDVGGTVIEVVGKQDGAAVFGIADGVCRLTLPSFDRVEEYGHGYNRL